MQTAQELYQKDIQFSDEAAAELDTMYAAVEEIVDMAFTAFSAGNIELAKQVEPLEQVIDQLKSQLKVRHIARLQRGACTTVLGFVFNDLITNYERIADHCSNIAICLIEVSKDSMDAHDYLNKLMASYNNEFNEMYVQYVEKYQLD